MPVELQVIRASEFIRLGAEERLDFEASKKALEALALACRKRALDRAVLDLRHLPKVPKAQFTPTELAALVRTFQETGFSRRYRLAILYHTDPFGGVRNFEFFSRMRGLQVQAFTEFEAALHWLSEEGEGYAGSERGEVPIPITRPRQEDGKIQLQPATDQDCEPKPRKRARKRARL
jgi:hypothetical protein